MDYNYLLMVGRLIFALIIVLGSIYLISSLTSKKINELNENKNIKVLERTHISKDTIISIVKIGDKGYILATSKEKCDKIDDLSLEDIEKIEKTKKRSIEISKESYTEFIDRIKKKIKSIKSKKYI